MILCMLLRQAIADTQALNRRYPSSRPRFYLLHRQPEWNPAEGTWMGYERKRGKLALLNSWLRYPGRQFVSVADMAITAITPLLKRTGQNFLVVAEILLMPCCLPGMRTQSRSESR